MNTYVYHLRWLNFLYGSVRLRSTLAFLLYVWKQYCNNEVVTRCAVLCTATNFQGILDGLLIKLTDRKNWKHNVISIAIRVKKSEFCPLLLYMLCTLLARTGIYRTFLCIKCTGTREEKICCEKSLDQIRPRLKWSSTICIIQTKKTCIVRVVKYIVLPCADKMKLYRAGR